MEGQKHAITNLEMMIDTCKIPFLIFTLSQFGSFETKVGPPVSGPISNLSRQNLGVRIESLIDWPNAACPAVTYPLATYAIPITDWIRHELKRTFVIVLLYLSWSEFENHVTISKYNLTRSYDTRVIRHC